MSGAKPQKLSTRRWVIGILTFALVVAAAITSGQLLGELTVGPRAPVNEDAELGHFPMVMLGCLLVFVGLLGYVLILATNFFKSDFSSPFMPTIIYRIRTGNFTAQFAIMFGVSFIAFPLFFRMLGGVVPETFLVPASGLLPFVLMQMFFIWLDMWAPVQHSMIRRRLMALGIAPEYIASGVLAGISDPASKRRLGLIEDDMGMLWFTPGVLVYRGDTRWFDIRADQLLAIERKAHERAVTSYFGAVHIILRYNDPEGVERTLMLHSEEAWTMTGAARALNRLAEQVETWWEEARAANLTASAAPAS